MSYSQAKAKHDAAASAADSSTAPHLMCAAHGCPNRWTVDPGRLCSAHAWAEPNRWPEITQAQQWDETERARMRNEPPPPESLSRRVRDPDRLRVLLRRFADHVRDREQDPRRWARKLQAREEADPRSLNALQREWWRDALAAELARQQREIEEAGEVIA